MKGTPRVVLGLPAFKRPDTLRRTLESLLSQSYRDFALIIVADEPSSAAAAIVAEYVPDCPHLTYETNPVRLGMVGNWRAVFRRGRELYPTSEFFAWVSDHDVWHPHWLQELVAALDHDPAVVLAYPQSLRMLRDDIRIKSAGFETTGMTTAAERIRAAARYLLAGDMIYGLMRVEALAAAGVFRRVVTPDRQLLLALSLFGQFRQVRDVLWYREFVRTFSLRRQREVFFPDGTPLYAYAPSHLQHWAVLLWDFGIRGRGRPAFGRLAGIRYATIQLLWSVVRQLRQRKAPWRLTVQRIARVPRDSAAIHPTWPNTA
jgi:glycosyltransferase involved in cell wall biosynthesis